MRTITICILSTGMSMLLIQAHAQEIDTTKVYSLPEVTVSDRYQTREVRAAAPLQVMFRSELKALNALQVSDAVKHFAGVTVKDYGGIGGLKTVSLRSLGAQHTTVSYDGIAVTDCQTGQVDIGRFSLENVDRLMLSNGQNDQIFQPARLFASAGVLNIQTLTPQFNGSKTWNAEARVKTGSWGMLNPALSFSRKLGEKWALSASGEWMRADGQYPYTLYYGDENDLSSREKRQNTEVETFRIESELFGNFSDKEQWRLKAYYYQSSRGLPNAATFYYPYSSQHLWDKNAFVQSRYQKELSRSWVIQCSGKWNWSYQRYLDPDYKNAAGVSENNYYQQEYYLSASVLYRVLDRLSFSLSTDGSLNTLHADAPKPVRPERYSWLTALAGKYVADWCTVSASLLATVIHDRAAGDSRAQNYRKFSPFVSASFKPFASEDLRFRVFYKDIFRLPSFNDLYYGQSESRELKPENARQVNVGITYSKSVAEWLPYVSATVDAYHNRVSDKIVAVPTKNLFVWSVVNLGKVDIKGIDIAGQADFRPASGYLIGLSGNYTYQRALDVTDSDPNTMEGKTYGHQIAYTPRISGSGQARLETPWVNLSYALVFSGKRYVLGQNLAKNRLPGYTDHSVSASRSFPLKRTTVSVSAEVLNLLDKNYEIIKNFPMPGRSFRISLGIKY